MSGCARLTRDNGSCCESGGMTGPKTDIPEGCSFHTTGIHVLM